MHRSQCFCHFFKMHPGSRCSVRAFSTACDSASLTSFVSKWREGFQFYLQLGKQKSCKGLSQASRASVWIKLFCFWRKRKRETVRCYDATARSFVAKVRGEVSSHFDEVAIECHNMSTINPALVTSDGPGNFFLNFAQNFLHICCSFVGYTVPSDQARFTTPIKRT
jgi:hypothetical protein